MVGWCTSTSRSTCWPNSSYFLVAVSWSGASTLCQSKELSFMWNSDLPASRFGFLLRGAVEKLFVDGENSAWAWEVFWCILWARFLIKDIPLALWCWRFYCNCTAVTEQHQSLCVPICLVDVRLHYFFHALSALSFETPRGLSEVWRLWGQCQTKPIGRGALMGSIFLQRMLEMPRQQKYGMVFVSALQIEASAVQDSSTVFSWILYTRSRHF